MSLAARKFSQNSYDKNDQWAKDLFVPFLIEKGYTIMNEEEDFSFDITTEKDGETVYFELEVKTNYPFKGRKTFPFESVSFAGRKHKLHQKHPFYYIIICRETQCCISAFSGDIYDKTYEQEIYIETNVRDGMDKLFRVPLSKCSFFKLKSNTNIKNNFKSVLNSYIGKKIDDNVIERLTKDINEVFSQENINVNFDIGNIGSFTSSYITAFNNIDELYKNLINASR